MVIWVSIYFASGGGVVAEVNYGPGKSSLYFSFVVAIAKKGVRIKNGVHTLYQPMIVAVGWLGP